MFDEIWDVSDTHFAETYANTQEAKSYPPHCIYNSWGWHKAVEFKDNILLINIYKSTTNLWNEENNYCVLRQDLRECEIFLYGLLSDVCVKQAMDGFLSRGAKVVILEDLSQGIKQQIPEILRQEPYLSYVELGKLRQLNSAQFFRSCLLMKKVAMGRVNNLQGDAR